MGPLSVGPGMPNSQTTRSAEFWCGAELVAAFLFAILPIVAHQNLPLARHAPISSPEPTSTGPFGLSADWWLVIFTGVLTASTTGLWLETRDARGGSRRDAERQAREFEQSLEQTRSANQTAKDHLLAANRPWLKVSATIQSGIKWQDDKIELSFLFLVENVGSSPALNVELDAKIDPWGGDTREAHKERCEGWRAVVLQHGALLFPGDKFTQEWTMRITAEDVAKAREEMVPGVDLGLSPIFPILNGCAVYKSSHGAANHITAFSFRFGELTDNNPALLPRGFRPEGVDLPRSQVAFNQDFWSCWAD